MIGWEVISMQDDGGVLTSACEVYVRGVRTRVYVHRITSSLGQYVIGWL